MSAGRFPPTAHVDIVCRDGVLHSRNSVPVRRRGSCASPCNIFQAEMGTLQKKFTVNYVSSDDLPNMMSRAGKKK